jgi:cation-transporting P-type ATPase 13A2
MCGDGANDCKALR